jgi:hypothetical protein
MKMKNNQQILVFIVVFLVTITGVLGVRPDLSVSAYSIKEGKAEVGKDFTLLLTISNKHPDSCARNILTTVQAGYPFIMRGVSSVFGGDICMDNETVVEFPMRIDPTASGGFYQITVLNSFESTTLAQFSSTDVLNVFVYGSPDIKANIINSQPVDIYPGDSAAITVNIENQGSFEAQSVNAKLTAQSPVEVKWSKSYSSLGVLSARQAKAVDFEVEIPKDADAKDYSLKLFVSYLDQNLTSQTKEVSLLLHVSPKAIFEFIDSGSDSLFANENSRQMKLTLKNTGTDSARNIKLRLQPMYPFSTDGSVRYIDIIEPGKTSEVQFTIDVDKDGTPGKYALDMLIDYEDAQGKALHDTAKVSLSLKSKGILRSLFFDYWFLWIIGLVVFLIVRKKKQGDKKKK